MLKFIKHNMDTIIGIELFPLISFIIFFLFFIVLFLWVLKMKKSDVAVLAAMPLEENELASNKKENRQL